MNVDSYYMELPAPWHAQYTRHVHKADCAIVIVVGKQRRGGFDTDLGYAKYSSVLKCLQQCSSLRADAPDCINIKNAYSSNLQLSKTIDTRLCIGSYVPDNKSWADQSTDGYSLDVGFYTICLREGPKYELSFIISDMEYARKHSSEFILGSLVKESINLTARTDV